MSVCLESPDERPDDIIYKHPGNIQRSEAHEEVTLLHAGQERLPKNEGVKTRPQLLRHCHDDVQVPLHC